MQLVISLLMVCLILIPSIGDGLDNSSDSAKTWNLHSQLTVVEQYHPGFAAPYSGTNSLRNLDESAMTVSTTLWHDFDSGLGARCTAIPKWLEVKASVEQPELQDFPMARALTYLIHLLTLV